MAIESEVRFIGDHAWQIACVSEGVWAVFYDTKPINLKTSNILVQYPGPKYKKVSFSNPGHAKNLARKLNTQFKTDKFTVVLLKSGDQIYP